MDNPTKEEGKSRVGTKLHDGFCDNLEPVAPLDLGRCRDADELARAMSKTAFAGRSLGEAVDVFYAMATDPDCFVVHTVSGAMTVAKMGLIICDMMDKGLIHAMVSTGALMAHGFVEATGRLHFKYDPRMNDRELYYGGYDRVYDTLELEKNLDDTETIMDGVFEKADQKTTLCSWKINKLLGEYLSKKESGRAILKSAYKKKIPVYVPAFTDSELGLDLGLYNRKQKLQGRQQLNFNPMLDLDHFADLLVKQKRLGIFTIGGGVPRNWAQQIGPYLDLIRYRVMKEEAKGKHNMDAALRKTEQMFKRYRYGVRICPEPVHWGGLSGCTYSEGVTWGKLVPKSEGGRWAEVLIDATVGWPLLMKAVLERLKKNRSDMAKIKDKAKRIRKIMAERY